MRLVATNFNLSKMNGFSEQLIHEANKAFKPELKIHLRCDQPLHIKCPDHKRTLHGTNSLRVIPESSIESPRCITICPGEDNDYVYLQGTSYSSLTPGFRHGPIVIPIFNTKKGPSVLDTTQDWTSFQTAIAGIDWGPSEPCYKEEINVEDIRSWLEELGLEHDCISALTSWRQSLNYWEHRRSLFIKEPVNELITLHDQASTDNLVMACNLENDLVAFLEWESQIVGPTEIYWLNS
jgi:hypothetical protein